MDARASWPPILVRYRIFFTKNISFKSSVRHRVFFLKKHDALFLSEFHSSFLNMGLDFSTFSKVVFFYIKFSCKRILILNLLVGHVVLSLTTTRFYFSSMRVFLRKVLIFIFIINFPIVVLHFIFDLLYSYTIFHIKSLQKILISNFNGNTNIYPSSLSKSEMNLSDFCFY